MKLLRGPLPGMPRDLIEAQTVAAGGCRREVFGRVAEAAVPDEARQLVAELLQLSATAQPAVALALGYEYDQRRLKADELLRRLVSVVLLQHLGAREIFASPVSYQSRARWDLYAPDREALVALNHLVEETDALQHVIQHHARTVFWAPAGGDRDEGWYVLRYTALEPWPAGRNWFDEVVRQNERQSAERRELQVTVRGLEGAYETAQSILARAYAALDRGEYLTVAEEVETSR